MPSDRVFRIANKLHGALLHATGGRLGKRVSGMPILELTTTGRKSGRPHTVLLTTPMRRGVEFIVVAAKGGEDAHPAWFLNLRSHPEVTVAEVGGAPQPMRARVLAPAERAQLWPTIAATFTSYAAAQRKRPNREIPLVGLAPR